MIQVSFHNTHNYKFDLKLLEDALKKFFVSKKILKGQVYIAFMNKSEMLQLAKAHLGEENVLHEILSFPALETRSDFVYPPKSASLLGEIVICYPQVLESSIKKKSDINYLLEKLLVHGAKHLIGIHHK